MEITININDSLPVVIYIYFKCEEIDIAATIYDLFLHLLGIRYYGSDYMYIFEYTVLTECLKLH